MNKTIVIIWLPATLGLLLLAVVKIDLYQFSNNGIEVRDMLMRELPIVVIGLLFSLIIFLTSFYWLLKKIWLKSLQAIISPLIFVYCFGWGGYLGAAYLNAT